MSSHHSGEGGSSGKIVRERESDWGCGTNLEKKIFGISRTKTFKREMLPYLTGKIS